MNEIPEAEFAAATLQFLQMDSIPKSQVANYVACHNWLQSKVDAANEEKEDAPRG